MVDPIEVVKTNAEEQIENIHTTEVDDEEHLTISLTKPYPRSELELRQELTNGNPNRISISDKYMENGNYCLQIYYPAHTQN